MVSHELTVYFSIFNLFKRNELWPYYEKHVNQIILNSTTLWSLALQIAEANCESLFIVNLFLNQILLTFLLCMRQTLMTQLILAISLWGYLPLIWKDSSTHTHGLTVYMKEQLYFTHCLTSFSSINHLQLCARFLILFHLT